MLIRGICLDSNTIAYLPALEKYGQHFDCDTHFFNNYMKGRLQAPKNIDSTYNILSNEFRYNQMKLSIIANLDSKQLFNENKPKFNRKKI